MQSSANDNSTSLPASKMGEGSAKSDTDSIISMAQAFAAKVVEFAERASSDMGYMEAAKRTFGGNDFDLKFIQIMYEAIQDDKQTSASDTVEAVSLAANAGLMREQLDTLKSRRASQKHSLSTALAKVKSLETEVEALTSAANTIALSYELELQVARHQQSLGMLYSGLGLPHHAVSAATQSFRPWFLSIHGIQTGSEEGGEDEE